MPIPFSIIVPCYNPFEGWAEQLADRANEFRTACGRNFQLILIDDASVKGISEQDIDFLRKEFPLLTFKKYEKNRGKGYAVRFGVKEANTDLILYTDIDFPYTTESMLRVLKTLEEGADIVVGSRDEDYYESNPKRRTFISKVLRGFFRIFFHLPVTDTQCGLKGFNRRGKVIFLKTKIERFLFDMEFIARAAKHKDVKMLPMSVTLRSDVQFSRMNLRILLTESVNLLRIFWFANFG